MIDSTSLRSISQIELLIELLAHRVGATTSFAGLARDLQVDPKTVRHWLEVLENWFVIFKVMPFHKNIARSILKEPKYYFYDLARVKNGLGAKLENATALALKKFIDFSLDVNGVDARFYYLRTKDQAEVDFIVFNEDRPIRMLEVKTSDASLSPGFQVFRKFFPETPGTQLVFDLKKETQPTRMDEILRLSDWLTAMPLFQSGSE